jgi:hypothetical protein
MKCGSEKMKKLYLIRTNNDTGDKRVYPYSTEQEKRDFRKIEDLDGMFGYHYEYRYLDESELVYVIMACHHPANAGAETYILGSYSSIFDAEDKYREIQRKYIGNTDFSLSIITLMIENNVYHNFYQ